MPEENKPVEKKPEPVEPEKAIKALYQEQKAIKPFFEKKRQEMKDGRDASKREALSSAMKAMKESAITRDAAKQKAKELYDGEAERAKGLTQKAIDELKAELDGRLKELHRAYEKELEHAREVHRVATAPVEGKMADDNAQIDVDFINEMKAIDEKEAAALARVEKDIQALHKKLNHTGKKEKANEQAVRPGQ